MRRKRLIRPKKPFRATPDQVRITRDALGAHIDYASDGDHVRLAGDRPGQHANDAPESRGAERLFEMGR